MLFAKLIRILVGILAFWLFLQLLKQIGRKKTIRYGTKQGNSSQSRRKFVESRFVEGPNQTEDKTEH